MSERRRPSTYKPPRARPAKDPRAESLPPVRHDTAPHAKPLRAGSEPQQGRVAQLEAEIGRLKAALEADSDKLAQMLVRVSQAERSRDAAEKRAREAVRARDEADQRAREAEARGIPSDARPVMAKIDSWLEELERGENMAQALRVFMIQQARLLAGGSNALPGSDATIIGDDDVEDVD